MSSMLVILLVLAGNLMPSDVNKCTITMSGNEMKFSRTGNEWSIEKQNNDKVKQILIGEVNGAEFVANHNGKEHKVDTSKVFGISDVKELKNLKTLKIDNEDYDIIKASDSIIIKSKDKIFASISWENKK